MATRFYLGSGGVAAPVSVTFDAGWAITSSAISQKLIYKQAPNVPRTAFANTSQVVPITTTQNILFIQYVSDPIPPQRLTGSAYMVGASFEDVATANAYICFNVRVVSNDGATIRGTPLAITGTGATIESVVGTPVNTRIVGNGTTTNALTPLSTQIGDRLVVEVGILASAPTTSGNATMQFGNNAAETTFASGNTGGTNFWVEFSTNLFTPNGNNYQFVRVGDGMSTGEKIR